MAKKPTVTTLQSGFNSTETLNANFEALRDGFDNTLSLDGSTPNAMEADLDLNGNNIIGAAGLLINGTDYLLDAEAAKVAAQAAQAAAETAETNAETAETNAEASETAASLSATAAATSETNAGASETAASGSATASATSATNSATSASEAAASASAASTSETNAATSETNAATSETNAATSATESETAKTAAEAAKDAALAALDSFDDRYLGAKASDPTLDNDGNALVAGALYYNTTSDVMNVYEGSVWVAAYASLSGALLSANNLSDLTNATAARTNLGLATVASTGGYSDLTGKPTLGTAAATASTDYATAAQGTLADSALQDITGESIKDLSDVASMTPSDGQALVYGSGVWSAADMAGGIAYTLHTANVTMAANEGVIANTSGGTFTVTLPASPATGDTVVIVDGDDWATNNLTVARNGSTIKGDAEDMLMNIGGVAVQFTYDGTTWQIYTTVGADNSQFATAAQGALADTALQPTGDGSGLTGISPFKPTTVTGTTPSLDVGSYNFFSNGTLTVDTTVSFSNVPTEARWTYTAEVGNSISWDLSIASYVRGFSVGSQDSNPSGVFFKPDGTAMYVIGTVNDTVYQYTLSTAWNISTASSVTGYYVGSQESNPQGVFFKPDGTAMYVIGSTGRDINEYDLSTAWDISTASYVRNFYVGGQETVPMGVFFKPDGTKMYVAGYSNSVHEYSLSTAWDISTASYVRNFSVSAQVSYPVCVFFKPDGTAMYVIGAFDNRVYEYSLSTAWDISTASYVRNFLTGLSYATNVFFKPDGTAMYVTASGNDSVNEYSMASIATLTLPEAIQNPPSVSFEFGSKVIYDFYTLDGGTTVILTNEKVI